MRIIVVLRSMVGEAFSWLSWRTSHHPAVESPCIPGNSPRSLSARRFLLALARRKQTVVRDQLPLSSPPIGAFDSRARGLSIPLARRRSSCPPPSSNLEFTHPIERPMIRSRMLPPPTRLSAKAPHTCVSRVPPPSEGHRIGAWKSRTGWTASSNNQTTAAASPPIG